MTGAELVAASLTGAMAIVVVLGYLADGLGLALAPFALLACAVIAVGLVAARVHRLVVWDLVDLAAWAGVTTMTLAWLAWLTWPAWLPPGRGPDLTHHLLLVDYIERSGHLVRDLALETSLGEMAHYTPGAHLLAVVAGRWVGADGFHAFYPVVTCATALAVGFAYLITRRLLAAGPARIPLALVSAGLLVLARAYVSDAFTHDGFLTQAVSVVFAVAMWWAVVVWDERPAYGLSGLVSLFGMAVFLTWPVWLGPPVMAFVLLVAAPRTMASTSRLRHLVIGVGPVLAIAALHATGRAGWILLVRTSGAVVQPSVATVGWVFPLLALAGVVVAFRTRRARVTLVLLLAIAAQAVTLFVMSRSIGAHTPYMAFKMLYLAVYPLAAIAALALSAMVTAGRDSHPRVSGAVAWALCATLAILAGRSVLAAPRPMATISDDLYQAGRWARANTDPACVDYLVPDALTAYWLHLAVLGNARMSARTSEVDRYDPRAAIGRWIVSGGLPYAIVDLPTVPHEVRDTTDSVAEFGTAGVIRRRDGAACEP